MTDTNKSERPVPSNTTYSNYYLHQNTSAMCLQVGDRFSKNAHLVTVTDVKRSKTRTRGETGGSRQVVLSDGTSFNPENPPSFYHDTFYRPRRAFSSASW